MKISIRALFVLLVLILSCSSRQIKKQISEFEKVIGIENYKTLTLLTDEFEKNIIKKNYPSISINKAYKKFLIDVKENYDFNMTFRLEILPKNREIFKKSDLRLEIYEFPDSV